MADPLILDRYRLVERLASGGSAEVWRANDEQLGREVAVKRLHPHLVPDDASRKRLAAEARAVAGLSHPVIVGIYDVDAAGESPALVMELVDGESLAARIARTGPLSPSEGAVVAADVAEALFHAHQRGVIHRDVKPGNVLLSSDGRTRLVDFGIAHSLATASERLTLAGTVIGTLHAMAPEQLSGGPITPRTDLYGLGVVLHESLTAKPPYPASSPVALADAQRAGPPALDGVEPALAAVIAGCLAFDPADRPLHAGALASALRAWLAGDSAPALALAPAAAAVTMPHAAPVAAPVAVAAAAPKAPTPAADRRGTRLAPILAVAALVLLALAAFAVLNPNADGGAGSDTTQSPSPSVTVETPEPDAAEWLPGLIDEVQQACSDEVAANAAQEMAGLNRGQAQRYARDLVQECQNDDDD